MRKRSGEKKTSKSTNFASIACCVLCAVLRRVCVLLCAERLCSMFRTEPKQLNQATRTTSTFGLMNERAHAARVDSRLEWLMRRKKVKTKKSKSLDFVERKKETHSHTISEVHGVDFQTCLFCKSIQLLFNYKLLLSSVSHSVRTISKLTFDAQT